MKRHLIAVLIGLGTFGLGITLAAQYYSDIPGPVAEINERLVFSTPACKENSSSFPGLSKSIESLTKFRNGYFPVKEFDDGWKGAGGFYEEWYGKHLRVMRETSLLDNKNEDLEVYRFLWLRTFHHPVMVRIERDGYSFNLRSIELNGAGGYEPGRIWRTDNIEISHIEWCEFTSLLDKAEFWKEQSVQRERNGVDGAQWILEGLNDQRYHIVDRWSPHRGDFREACLYLLKLTGRDEKSLRGELY